MKPNYSTGLWQWTMLLKNCIISTYNLLLRRGETESGGRVYIEHLKFALLRRDESRTVAPG